jgi:hypothetical protein
MRLCESQEMPPRLLIKAPIINIVLWEEAYPGIRSQCSGHVNWYYCGSQVFVPDEQLLHGSLKASLLEHIYTAVTFLVV